MEISEGLHLGYCTNIHPGETWETHFQALKKYVPPLKAALSPDKPFGIGLRLSAKAARQLEKSLERKRGGAINDFQAWLEQEGIYVFTMNGFPYGAFHGEPVKDRVHHPDWSAALRRNYTQDLMRIARRITPEGGACSISTSPLSYRHWHKEGNLRTFYEDACRYLMSLILELYTNQSLGNKLITLNFEPEPDGLFETTEEVIRFFQDYLLDYGVQYGEGGLGWSKTALRERILNHFRVCYDVCHGAVGYEDPATAFDQLEAAGIKVGKIQLSAALKADLSAGVKDRGAAIAELAALDEPVYLHQVVARDAAGGLHRFRDLPEAVPELGREELKECRTHFHVPLFVEDYGLLQSTQADVKEVIRLVKERQHCQHLEVETYTWEVLPEALRMDLGASIRREMEWTLGEFRG